MKTSFSLSIRTSLSFVHQAKTPPQTDVAGFLRWGFTSIHPFSFRLLKLCSSQFVSKSSFFPDFLRKEKNMDFYADTNHSYKAPRDKSTQVLEQRAMGQIKSYYWKREHTRYLKMVPHRWFGIDFVLHHKVNYLDEMEGTWLTVMRVIDKWC